MASVLNPDSGSLHILGTLDTLSGISTKLNITNTANVSLAAPTLGEAALNVTGGGYVGGHLYVDGSIVANGDIITLGNSGSGIIIDASPETVTTTIDAGTSASYINSSTSASLVLLDGTEGQVKIITAIDSPTGSVVVTPSNLIGYTSFTLSATADSVTLLFTVNGWVVTAIIGAIVTI